MCHYSVLLNQGKSRRGRRGDIREDDRLEAQLQTCLQVEPASKMVIQQKVPDLHRNEKQIEGDEA